MQYWDSFWWKLSGRFKGGKRGANAPTSLWWLVPYSRKLLREKFSRISRFCGYTREFSPRNLGVVSFGAAKASNLQKFSPQKSYFHQFAKVFSLESFPLYCNVLRTYLHESIKWLCSSGMQQQQPGTVTHSHISSLLISRCLNRPKVASRYSVRTSSYFKQLTPKNFQVCFTRQWLNPPF